MVKKKEKSTMQKMSKFISWGMLLALILGVGFPLILALRNFFRF